MASRDLDEVESAPSSRCRAVRDILLYGGGSTGYCSSPS